MASIADEFSDRVGFFTILIDAERDSRSAINILEDANAQFLTLKENDNVFEVLAGFFASGYIPESVIFDRDGNVVDSIVGGDANAYRTMLESALNG